jgi:hypothetical protein
MISHIFDHLFESSSYSDSYCAICNESVAHHAKIDPAKTASDIAAIWERQNMAMAKADGRE